jgi:hypothetical protein
VLILKHQADQTWQAALVARYTNIFQVTENGRAYTAGYPSVGDGWRELIETVVGRIAEAVAAAPPACAVIVETKEKYGTLRLYWHGKNMDAGIEHAVKEAVALAEARSACTCEVCGRAGVLHARGDWLATACPEHAKGVPVPMRHGWENLHLVGDNDGKAPMLVCRRYIRETDSFIDVDPSSLGIYE